METVAELREYLKTLLGAPKEYNIAVGSLIFNADNHVVLIERGPGARDEIGKLEGVGGSLDEEDNLHKGLLREIKEELGDIDVAIDRLLTVMVLPGEKNPFWVVPVYLCRLISGTPKIMEPDKCTAIHTMKISKIDESRLSRFQKETMQEYTKKYGVQPYNK